MIKHIFQMARKEVDKLRPLISLYSSLHHAPPTRDGNSPKGTTPSDVSMDGCVAIEQEVVAREWQPEPEVTPPVNASEVQSRAHTVQRRAHTCSAVSTQGPAHPPIQRGKTIALPVAVFYDDTPQYYTTMGASQQGTARTTLTSPISSVQDEGANIKSFLRTDARLMSKKMTAMLQLVQRLNKVSSFAEPD